MNKRILIVEDEKNIVDIIAFNLKKEGYTVITAADGEEGVQKAMEENPDLILLDIMLPGEDGITILRRLRAAPDTAKIPVILLTAKNTEYDKVVGLDTGADDYIPKPFGMMELISRVRALLRRAEFGRERRETLRCGDIECDTTTHTMRACGEELTLTLKEYELLHLMLEHPMQVFTRDRLLSSIWGYESSRSAAWATACGRLRYDKTNFPVHFSGGPRRAPAERGTAVRRVL